VERPVTVLDEFDGARDGGVGTPVLPTGSVCTSRFTRGSRRMFVVLRRPLIVLNRMSSRSRVTKITDVCGEPSALVVARTER
jgi:hypothetical protein